MDAKLLLGNELVHCEFASFVLADLKDTARFSECSLAPFGSYCRSANATAAGVSPKAQAPGRCDRRSHSGVVGCNPSAVEIHIVRWRQPAFALLGGEPNADWNAQAFGTLNPAVPGSKVYTEQATISSLISQSPDGSRPQIFGN